MADKQTVISLVPYQIISEKPGLYPGYFTIPAAKENDFEFIVVGRSKHYVYLDQDRGSLPVTTPSDEVARSICQDFIQAKTGQGVEPGIAEPGIFWVDGEYKDKKTILATFKDKIEAARARQRQWFVNLVEMADDDWSKYHTHKSISDLQRQAARSLNLEREWNVEATADAIALCPACKSPVQAGAIICGSCRTVINPKAYKDGGFVQAGA